MFSAVFMITFAESAADAERENAKFSLKGLADGLSPVNILGDVLPYAFGGGDYFAEIGFETQDAYEAAKTTAEWESLQALLTDDGLIDHFEFVAYGEGKLNITGEEAACHRVLIYEIIPDADPAALEKMERIMPDMADYIPGLINCKLAKVVESSGTMNWGYAFECDFDDPMTFLTNYNFRPYHWTNVDKFFEPACSEWVADPNLCTPYIAADSAFLLNYRD